MRLQPTVRAAREGQADSGRAREPHHKSVQEDCPSGGWKGTQGLRVYLCLHVCAHLYGGMRGRHGKSLPILKPFPPDSADSEAFGPYTENQF
jgi:hypothetical protein